ncbi:MAG: CDP-diacylglycerol--glycerol-3-phosphate 3-phosphatidyltransferase [Ruminococcaceae bacterium]|nr:CDP-diacylglycerol--glycerol-3-phosphate 3-phosphatidyltransferase [Oscillospiraceae bacterium]
MNLANKITMSRILLIPLFMIAYMWDFAYNELVACAIFAVASLTDGVDGYVARNYNMVTDFGKFIDPLADKLLVATALICFVGSGEIAAYMAIVIIAREFIVTGLRTVAMSKGVVIAASMTGKIKTCVQIGAVICVFLLGKETYTFNLLGIDCSIGYIAMFVATLFTVYSGIEYLAKNKKLLEDH